MGRLDFKEGAVPMVGLLIHVAGFVVVAGPNGFGSFLDSALKET